MVMALVLPEQHCITTVNVRSEMETLVREHGVNSFQMFMAYKDTMMLRDSELYQTLQTCKDIGAVARVHAENGELVAEKQGFSGPEGKVVHAETTVAHAVLNGMQYYRQDWVHAAAHVVVPPLRLDPNTPGYLMGLLGNDSLSVVASEHRPFSIKQRALGKDDFTKIPHGVAGVQDRMSVIWERGVVRTNTRTHVHIYTLKL
uniref:dihydropyrimidinase-related protein 5-like n=1 Tax=Gasterosteus aculeatus aculeatus TaxID=481459 RepID=UPI001A98B6FF|nr:dihydropyrimidinase-related protein 5-like [Gasterosteus aculeatus aculeatus]